VRLQAPRRSLSTGRPAPSAEAHESTCYAGAGNDTSRAGASTDFVFGEDGDKISTLTLRKPAAGAMFVLAQEVQPLACPAEAEVHARVMPDASLVDRGLV